MSDHIPFEIQSEIIKRLPVKSLIQFRSVSKQWKDFIDNPKFIKNYHINHTNPQHHLLVHYKFGSVQTYTSIIDDNTFPQQMFPLTIPESLSLLRNTFTFSSVDGLLCFYGSVDLNNRMAVIWNPTIRKSVGIVIRKPEAGYKHTIVGFGVCRDTSSPKLVKITTNIKSMWVVEVFTLSTRVWKIVYVGAPFKSCSLMRFHVFVNGVIYFRAHRVRSNFVIAFDLKSEKLGEVCLPERLLHALDLDVTKVNESLGLLEYCNEGEMWVSGVWVCGVWTRKDDANETFTKIYTIKVEEGKWLFNRVLGFRNNGEAVISTTNKSDYTESRIDVYKPLSGHTNAVGINGKAHTFSARSYMETLLLLNESDSIIH